MPSEKKCLCFAVFFSAATLAASVTLQTENNAPKTASRKCTMTPEKLTEFSRLGETTSSGYVIELQQGCADWGKGRYEVVPRGEGVQLLEKLKFMDGLPEFCPKETCREKKFSCVHNPTNPGMKDCDYVPVRGLPTTESIYQCAQKKIHGRVEAIRLLLLAMEELHNLHVKKKVHQQPYVHKVNVMDCLTADTVRLSDAGLILDINVDTDSQHQQHTPFVDWAKLFGFGLDYTGDWEVSAKEATEPELGAATNWATIWKGEKIDGNFETFNLMRHVHVCDKIFQGCRGLKNCDDQFAEAKKYLRDELATATEYRQKQKKRIIKASGQFRMKQIDQAAYDQEIAAVGVLP